MASPLGIGKELQRLADPFPPSDIEWRIGQAGLTRDGKPWAKCLAYITSRAIMERLDTVVGPSQWRNEFREWPLGTTGVLCGLSIKIGTEWVTKWDGADQPETEPVKGGFSNALKRAGVLWGIGRYLYDLPEGFATISEQGKHYQSASKKKSGETIPAFKWDPPSLPKWALPTAALRVTGDRATTEQRDLLHRIAQEDCWTEEERLQIERLVDQIEEGSVSSAKAAEWIDRASAQLTERRGLPSRRAS